MRKARRPVTKSKLPKGYAAFLTQIKSQVHIAQVAAVSHVNAELITLYWVIGDLIIRHQVKKGWGSGIIPRLSKDLRSLFPTIKGFSERNLGHMVRFAKDLGPPPILQQPAAKLLQSDALSASQQLALKIPWFHQVLLMEKIKDVSTRTWYLHRAIEYGWSRSVLALQIETKAHKRMGKATTNFKRTLPPMESDLVQQAIKDPYIFDFLTLSGDANEKELEDGLGTVNKLGASGAREDCAILQGVKEGVYPMRYITD